MLIIALGVLALMVILGTAFAQLMRLEKRATDNYVEASRMDMLLDSALDRVVADFHGGKNFRGWTYFNPRETPWLFLVTQEGDLAHGRMDVDDERVGKWEVFAEQVGQTYRYKTKVIDCAAQINLNAEQDTLARMLDSLGDAIERSARLKIGGRNVVNPLYTEPNRGGDKVRGAHIVQIRRRLPGGRFTSKTQLMQLIGPENFATIQDFVTVHSWVDPDTYKPTDGDNEVIDITGLGATGLAGGGRGIGGGGAAQPQQAVYMTASRVDPEPRSPININTAPKEVLVAALQGLACRRVFPYSRLGTGGSLVQADQNAPISGRKVNAQEEVRDVTPRAIFCYAPRLEYEHAERIADRIIGQRKMMPFTTWRTNNDNGMKGFEDLIDELEPAFFPAPGRVEFIDSDMPLNRQLNGQIMGGGGASPVGRLWVKGHGAGAVRQLRRQLGLSMHDQFAWFYDMVKGGIKANFNPNTRINRYNPNAAAFIPVDKSDLVWAQDRTRLWKGHTTEFCFEPMGLFEVTALASVARSEGAGSRSPAAVRVNPAVLARPSYEKKVRSIVQVYDVLRHTNQFQFEKNFVALGRSSKNDRKYTVTWPEPMAALTELVTSGSLRDGRVELAGMNDGLRQQMPVQMRMQFFRNFQSIAMGIGFQDRDAASIPRLKRVRQSGSGGLLGDEYSDALKDVLDAYSKSRSTNGKYYRRKDMNQLGAFKNSDAVWYDPLVGKEVLGTDIFPDGFSSSLLRTTHLQARNLVLPSHTRIGDTAGGGEDMLRGASGRGGRQNIRANVPYYKGGIAFFVKFDFDGDDPVFSGLIGCTSVIRAVQPSAGDWTGSEGTQFFIFKNSVGQLRVVRMYYHQAFLEGVSASGSSGGDDSGSSIRLYPDPGAQDAGGAGVPGMQNPILDELDQKKLISRSDIVVDVRHLKAHEWHHIAVEWDDENTVFPIRIYMDFEDVREAAPAIPQSIVDMTANSWVRLNERQPRDGLQIGGIVREQGVDDAGVFKWFTNTTRAGTGGGVQTVAQSVKRVLANATIDELVTFEGTFSAARQFYGGRAAPGYFTTQPGRYANVFEIALPPNVESVVLRTFDWTSYYPVLYTDSRLNSVPQPFPTKAPIRCRLLFNSDTTPPAEFSEPWRQPTVVNLVAGRRVFASSGSVEKRRKAEVVYDFTLIGARPQTGRTAGGVVGTPVIDDVTLTYFLPHPRILQQEEVE